MIITLYEERFGGYRCDQHKGENELNVFISGSNGYVGGWIAKTLSLRGFKIIGCGRRINYNSFVDTYYKWDIANDERPKELLSQKIDVIIHAAARINLDMWDTDSLNTNVIGTHRVMAFCKEIGCKKFILVSSGPVIGRPKKNIPITEEYPLNPQTLYHSTKISQEFLVSQLGSEDIRFYILRPSSPIAPTMKTKTIFSSFVENAVYGLPIVINGKGTRKQNYIDLRDFSLAIACIIEGKIDSGIYNVANEYTISNLELANLCIQIANSKSNIHFSGKFDPSDGEIWDYDISKIKAIGFTPRIPIAKTIEDMINCLRENNK